LKENALFGNIVALFGNIVALFGNMVTEAMNRVKSLAISSGYGASSGPDKSDSSVFFTSSAFAGNSVFMRGGMLLSSASADVALDAGRMNPP